jgi:hypothetical protein
VHGYEDFDFPRSNEFIRSLRARMNHGTFNHESWIFQARKERINSLLRGTSIANLLVSS